MPKATSYFTYIVECCDKTFYTGITKDINHRLLQHNGTKKGGAKYTSTRNPVSLKYLEEFPTLQLAMKRERAIKKLTRKEKEKIITNSIKVV